jgi:hypothetical protein
MDRIAGNLALKAIITSVSSAHPSPDAVKDLIALCRKIARAHLIIKNHTRYSYEETFGLSVDDLAMDSIAELFQRNDKSVLVQFQSYFDSVDIEGSSLEALLVHLKRLVYSKVNNYLMDLRSEYDPTFWKVLRNCKLAIQALRTYSIIDRLGDLYIIPLTADPLRHLPRMEQQDIEQLLFSVASGNDNIPTLLSKLSRVLQEQQEKSRMLRLLTVASAIRVFYVRTNMVDEQTDSIADNLSDADIQTIIRNVCGDIKLKLAPRYQGIKGVTSGVFGAYFLVIENHLCSKYISHNGHDSSLYDKLQVLYPELTRDEYSKTHRTKIEYLWKLTEKEALREFKKQL